MNYNYGKRIKIIFGLLYVMLTAVIVEWASTSWFQVLEISGKVEWALKNPARAEYMIAAMRELCKASFYFSGVSLVIAIALLVVIRRLRRELNREISGI